MITKSHFSEIETHLKKIIKHYFQIKQFQLQTFLIIFLPISLFLDIYLLSKCINFMNINCIINKFNLHISLSLWKYQKYYIAYRLISPMKEEKRKSTIIVNHLVKKTTQIKNIQKERAFTTQVKENAAPKQSLRKLLDKNVKRIGSKVTLKSFQTVISQNSDDLSKDVNLIQPNQNLYKNTFQVSDISNQSKQAHKKLKRIGKKPQVTAFKQVVFDQQLKGGNNTQVANEETIINIKQPNYINNQQNPIRIITIEHKINDDELQKNQQLAKNDQQILLTDQDADSLIFQKAVSDQGKADQSRDSFSINVNIVDGNLQINSAFDKSDRCVQSPITVQTQSDAAKSNSLILHGELENLINQQKLSYVPSSQNQEDSKIQQLLEEIQKNYAKNFQEIHNKQKKKPQRGSNYLQVPKGQHRMSDGKFRIEKKKSEQRKEKFQKENLGAVGEKSTLQQRKNSFKQGFSFSSTEKSQQQLLLEALEEETKHKSKPMGRNSNERRISNSKRKSKEDKVIMNGQIPYGNKGKRNSKDIILADNLKCDSILQQIEEAKEEEYKSQSTAKTINYQHHALVKKPLPPAFPVRQKLLAASQGPKILPDERSGKKLTQSISEYVNQPNSKNDISLSEVKLNQIKIKQYNIGSMTNSLHQQLPKNANVKLKRQSISKRFGNKKLKKTDSILEDIKITNSIKKNPKTFEANKCITEARKILHQSVHI